MLLIGIIPTPLGTGYELIESVHLRRLVNPRFAQPLCASTPPATPHFPLSDLPPCEAPLFFTANKVLIYNGLVRLLMHPGSSQLPLLTTSAPKPRFTALAKAAPVYLSTNEPVPVYLATGSRFSLLSLHSPDRSMELVSFGERQGEVTHLQALVSPVGDRTGIIVGRRNGRVELWDDRWSQSPVVTFYGSDAGCSDASSISPITPRPVVDQPTHSTLASPLAGCPRIGVWQLKTGKLLNLLEYPSPGGGVDPLVTPPPLLLLRSQWVRQFDGMPVRGPALLSVGLQHTDFFYL